MTLPVLIVLWVFAATVTALLPMRWQFAPGLFLLFAAPVLIGFVWYQYGGWAGGAALAGFVSMFRRPLFYLARKALGRR